MRRLGGHDGHAARPQAASLVADDDVDLAREDHEHLLGAVGRRRVTGALRLAVAFPTWRTLTQAGLDDADAASVAAAFVATAGR